jgi:MinD-like ATPase involved in chromosome partitioning or flagellar assembly
MVPKENTFPDALSGKITMKESVYEHKSGVSISPSSLSPDCECNDFSLFHQKLDEVKDNYDFILIDGPSGNGQEAIAATKSSDGIFIVSEACLESSVAALRMVKIALKLNVPVKGMIINRVVSSRSDMTTKELEELWGTKVVCELPFDPSIEEGFSAQNPAALGKKMKSRWEFRNLSLLAMGQQPEKRQSVLDMIMRILRVRH